MQCHNPWAGHALSFTPAQLDRDYDYGGTTDNQLRALRHAGLITDARAPGRQGPPPTPPRLVDPQDSTAGLDERARSYLHVNCSHCHQFGAGGTSLIDLRRDRQMKETNALDARPVQGGFDIPDAKILAPGDPYRSVLYYRMAKLGRGRMPHVGSEIVDERGARLIHDWIRQLPFRADERALLARLREPGEAPAAAKQRAAAIDRLLATPSSALMLMEEMAQGRLSEPVRARVMTAVQSRPVPVRDLFERFLPDEQRVVRLGNVIDAAALLARKGDAARGRELFFKSASLCVNCHKVGGTGGAVGPDLSQIGKKYNRAQLLESILEPSKVIDPPYVAYLVETTDGKVLTGVVASKTPTEIVLRDAEAKEIRVPAAKVAKMEAQKKSLMPDQLLRDLTAEQAADLLEFLASLK
jgi:putative heme-binding domain-containing protein